MYDDTGVRKAEEEIDTMSEATIQRLFQQLDTIQSSVNEQGRVQERTTTTLEQINKTLELQATELKTLEDKVNEQSTKQAVSAAKLAMLGTAAGGIGASATWAAQFFGS